MYINESFTIENLKSLIRCINDPLQARVGTKIRLSGNKEEVVQRIVTYCEASLDNVGDAYYAQQLQFLELLCHAADVPFTECITVDKRPMAQLMKDIRENLESSNSGNDGLWNQDFSKLKMDI